jgi:hypothetical protein
MNSKTELDAEQEARRKRNQKIRSLTGAFDTVKIEDGRPSLFKLIQDFNDQDLLLFKVIDDLVQGTSKRRGVHRFRIPVSQ